MFGILIIAIRIIDYALTWKSYNHALKIIGFDAENILARTNTYFKVLLGLT